MSLSGIFLLDKPVGLSSHTALKRVKRLLNADKAGHTGTLDPLAHGLLPICLGEAAKFSQFFLDADKSYRTTLQLGQVSSTGDADGELSPKKDIPVLSKEKIEAVLALFRGPIKQIPPMYAAIKHQGKPLYRLARKGIEIERPARDLVIHQLNLVDFTAQTITIDVDCSKGTYIRVLGQDIGLALGCGAYLQDLRRTAVYPFRATQMCNLEELEALDLAQRRALLLPITEALAHLPGYMLELSEAKRILAGQKLAPLATSVPAGIYRLDTAAGFLGIGEIMEDGVLRAKRMLSSAGLGFEL